MARKGGISATTLLLIGGVAIASIYLINRKPPQVGKVSPCPPMGDVDGDGYVTEADADLVSNYAVGNITLTPEQLDRADVDGNGSVNIVDAMMIGQYVAGTRDTFPCCSI